MRYDKINFLRKCGKSIFIICTFLLLLIIKTSIIHAAETDFEISNNTLTKYNGSEEEITIPEGVTVIHTSAFEGNDTLKYIHFPNSLEHIGDGAFNGCKNLKRVDFPDNLQIIGGLAFRDCDSLDEVSFSGNIRQIGAMAFKDCDSLKTVTIASNVETIEYGVFSQCRNLQSIFVSDSNQAFSEKDGVLFNKDGTVLLQFPIGNTKTKYSIPQGTVTIGRDAFQEARISEIIIPEGVEVIEWRAFDKCQGLESIDLPTTITAIQDNAFSECVNLESVKLPSSNVEFGDSVFQESPSVIIYGIKKSAVEQYAKSENIQFQDIEDISAPAASLDRRIVIAALIGLVLIFVILLLFILLLFRSHKKQKDMVKEMKRLKKESGIQPSVVRSNHIQLFMIAPYDEKYKNLETAVRKVFENDPFFFEVRLARDYYDADTQMENVRKHLATAHGFIAEISERNANVMMEIGGILMTGDSRPVFSLCLESCAGNVPSDLNGTLLFQYSDNYSSSEDLAEQIRGLVIKDGRIKVSKLKQLIDDRKQHYLSKICLTEHCLNLSEKQIDRLCGKYMTLESLLKTSTADLQSLGLNSMDIENLKKLIET